VAGLALVALVACGGDSVTMPTPTSVVGSWTLKTYNGSPLPYTGSVNGNGSRDRVNSGTIAFDNAHTYVLDIRIVNTLGSTVTDQNFTEVGSYSGTIATGIILKPNDLSGGTNGLTFAEVPVTISGATLSFSQIGKILTFEKQ
jgi:hypothetical protein